MAIVNVDLSQSSTETNQIQSPPSTQDRDPLLEKNERLDQFIQLLKESDKEDTANNDSHETNRKPDTETGKSEL